MVFTSALSWIPEKEIESAVGRGLGGQRLTELTRSFGLFLFMNEKVMIA